MKGQTSPALVARLRELCMAMPDANERISHGEPTWFAGKGKVFAMLDDHHHGSPHLSVWLPLPLGMQDTLVELDDQRFFRPPYVGVKGWVGVVLDSRLDWAKLGELLRDAYVHVANKGQVQRLLAPGALPAPSAKRAEPSKTPRAKRPASRRR
jgi:predicted DNA-binding protein (MmcQ/YjbR family)